MDISLPKADNQKTAYKKNHTYIVNLDKECTIFFNKDEIDLKELKSRFEDVLKDKKYLVQIGADKDSKHSCFIDVLDVAKTVGIENLGILTKMNK
jgi:biopolymer transport protein ExbD